LGSNTITINGNINVGPQINVYNSNGTAITNSAPLPTMLVGNVTGNINGITTTVTVHQDPTSNLAINNLPVTQNVSFSNQSVTVSSIIAVTNTNIFNSNGVAIVNTSPLSTQVVSNSTNYVYVQQAPTWSTDALSKVRTSSTLNQDWFVPVVDDDTQFRWSQALNGTNANSQFLANTSEIQISSGNSSGGYAYRQTYSRLKIVPGTSHTVYTTVNWQATPGESGVVRRSGLFDENNGIYWEQGNTSANTLSIVVRRLIANGSVVEDRVYANNFNQDKLDGTGPSGMNIFTDGLNKYYTFWFDFIGGRTGRVRFGLGTPIGPQVAHVQSYSAPPLLGNTNYITDNSLPLRREIFNGTTGSFTTTTPVFNMSGISFQAEAPSAYNPSPTTTYNIAGYVPSNTALTPILTIGLRAGSPWNGSDITPGEFTIVDQNNQGKNTTPDTFLYTVVYNANINGTYAYNGNSSATHANTGRSSQYWTWSNTATITGGLTILSGLTQSGAATVTFDGLPTTYNLGSDINGNPATLTLCIQNLPGSTGGAANVVCTWNLIEQL